MQVEKHHAYFTSICLLLFDTNGFGWLSWRMWVIRNAVDM